MGTYQVRRSISTNGIALWFAEYITHSGEVRYLSHAAVPGPIHELVKKLSKPATQPRVQTLIEAAQAMGKLQIIHVK